MNRKDTTGQVCIKEVTGTILENRILNELTDKNIINSDFQQKHLWLWMFPVWAEACASHCRVAVDVKFKTVVSKGFCLKLLSVTFNWILPKRGTVTLFFVPPFFFLKKRTNAKGEQLTFDLWQRVATEVVQRLTYQSSFNQHGCRARQHCSTSTHTHFISMWRETHDEKNSKKMIQMILMVRDERWFEKMKKMWFQCVNCANTLLFFSSLQKLNYIYLIHLSLYR